MSSYDERDRDTLISRDPRGASAPPPMPTQYGYDGPAQGYGYGGGYRQPWGGGFGSPMMRGMGTETKPFFMTSEFIISLIVSLGIAITAASSHAFGAWRAWILIAGVTMAYNISRGIAKAGTKSRANDPREDINLGHSGRDHSSNGSGRS